MVHIETFDTPEQMEARLADLREAANRDLHPAQQAMTYGEHWLRIAEPTTNLVEFGYVFTPEEIRTIEREYGSTPAEADAAVRYAEEARGLGFLFGIAHSRDNPTGAYGNVHKASIWPIEPRLFQAAARFDYDIEQFDEVASVLLQIALAGLRVQRLVLLMREGKE